MNSDEELAAALSRLPRPTMPVSVREAIEQRLEVEAAAAAQALPPIHQRRLSGLVAAAAVAAFASLIGIGMPRASQPAPQRPVLHAGGIYTPASLGDELAARIRSVPTTRRTGTFADNPEGVRTCVRAVQAYGPLIAIDTGAYDRSAAVILVTRSVLNENYEEVWVVTPACGSGDGLVLRHMIDDLDARPGGDGLRIEE